MGNCEKTYFLKRLRYLKQRRWDFAQHKTRLLVTLNADLISLRHLDEIRRMMDNEKAEIIKKLEERAAQKSVALHN